MRQITGVCNVKFDQFLAFGARKLSFFGKKASRLHRIVPSLQREPFTLFIYFLSSDAGKKQVVHTDT